LENGGKLITKRDMFGASLRLEADLLGTTLSHATSLRQGKDVNLRFRENRSYSSFKTVEYIKENVVGY